MPFRYFCPDIKPAQRLFLLPFQCCSAYPQPGHVRLWYMALCSCIQS
jgi:hypothetical protein